MNYHDMDDSRQSSGRIRKFSVSEDRQLSSEWAVWSEIGLPLFGIRFCIALIQIEMYGAYL
jgi:hypothetical protein